MSNPKKPKDSDEVFLKGIAFTHKDIFTVVDLFYKKVAEDPMLKVPFASVHDWPEHIERLTHFWWMRFGGTPYMFTHYNPVQKHYFAGFNQEFLRQWLFLFHQVIQENLNNEQFEVWKQVSKNMGRGLSLRNEALKKEYERDDKK